MNTKALILLLLLAIAACDAPRQERVQGPASAPSQAQAQSADPGQRFTALPDFTPLMKQQGPAVVNVISTRKAAAGRPGQGQIPEEMLEFFRRFIPDLPERGGPEQGLGSGFIISDDGLILTNAHVVAEFDDIKVRLADTKREFKAKVVGIDPRTDIALIKVDAKGLPTAKLGNASKLQPGEWVAAIGSPFGFANTITAGIVSATQRSLPDEAYVPFIQTDVAVNPGNSGGPLLNLAGEVVGINSVILSATGGFMGVSFAIPIEVALDVAKQLQNHGKVIRGRIGIGAQPVTKELAEAFKLAEASGAVIVHVEPDSPAAKAGARTGDVVLSYNGKKVEDANELPRLVAASKPGSQATVEVWRGGKREQLKMTVGEFPAERTAARKPSAEEERTKAGGKAALGLAVRELAPEERKALGVDYGLVVLNVLEGPVAQSPLMPGDVILGVNQQRFSSMEEFNKLVGGRKKGEKVALLVRRGQGALYVPIESG